jgi:hypothetical protein
MARHELGPPLKGKFNGVTLLLIDRSISMSYGFGATKLEQCKDIIFKIQGNLGMFGILLFDHIVEEFLPIDMHADIGELKRALDPVPPRGTTALSAVLHRAVEILQSRSEARRIILLSDGRPNISLQGDVNECGPNIQAEALGEVRRGAENGIRMECIALGEDNFIYLMRSFSEITGGTFFTPHGGAFEGKPALAIEAVVHRVPEELPAGKPTWAKELDSEHLAVASEEAASAYLRKRTALLLNKASGKNMRIPLISIESEALRNFRERKGSISESVRRGNSILVDSANRRALDLKSGDRAFLKVF